MAQELLPLGEPWNDGGPVDACRLPAGLPASMGPGVDSPEWQVWSLGLPAGQGKGQGSFSEPRGNALQAFQRQQQTAIECAGKWRPRLI